MIQQGTHEQTHPRQPQRWTPSPGSASPALASPAGALQQTAAGDSAAPRQRPHSSSDEDLVSAQEGTPSEDADEEGGECPTHCSHPLSSISIMLSMSCRRYGTAMVGSKGKAASLAVHACAARQDAALCAPAVPMLQALPSPVL